MKGKLHWVRYNQSDFTTTKLVTLEEIITSFRSSRIT